MANAKKKSETAVAVKNSKGELVTYDYGDQAGAGWENTDQDDFAIPFINQLQAMSPQVEEGGEKSIKGAKPGMFVNSVTKELMTEVHFVPCLTQHVFVEWVPRDNGGGFVAIHDLRSPVVLEAKTNAVNRNQLKTPEGNDLIDTFYIYAALLGEDGEEVTDMAVMAFTSTKQKPYRDYLSTLRKAKGSAKIPLFAHRIKMVAVKAKNKAGQPYHNLEMSPMYGTVVDSLIPADSPILEQAAEFGKNITAGEVQVKHEKAESSESETDGVF